MNSDEQPRSSHYQMNRKTGQQKQGYSPSSNYNYNTTQSQHGNHSSNHGNTNFNSSGSKPHHRKPGGPFKRENSGSSDKLVKQNDLIIKLLKEIRDRLPEQPDKKIVRPSNENDVNTVDENDVETAVNVAVETAVETAVEQPALKGKEQKDSVGGEAKQVNKNRSGSGRKNSKSAGAAPKEGSISEDDDDIDCEVNGNV